MQQVHRVDNLRNEAGNILFKKEIQKKNYCKCRLFGHLEKWLSADRWFFNLPYKAQNWRKKKTDTLISNLNYENCESSSKLAVFYSARDNHSLEIKFYWKLNPHSRLI